MSNEDVVLKKKMDEAFHTMKDNTQTNDDENQLRIAKMNMPASVVDFLVDHYGFFDLVELNTLIFYIVNTFGRMEKDGFKFAAYRTVDGKVESYDLDIHDLIARFRIQAAKSMSKEKNEENSV